MKLGRPAKILLGIATCWPLIYVGLFVMFMATMVFWGGFGRHSSPRGGLPIEFRILFAAHILTILWIFALLAFYGVYLFKTDRIPQDRKALWAVVLFMGHALAMPIFFYFYVWKEPAPTPPPSPPTPPAAGVPS